MAEGYVGALDVGTSSVRGLLFDLAARQVPGVEVHLPYSPRVAADGTYQTDAAALLRLVTSAVDGLIQQAGDHRARLIRAIGISTFWHGLVAVTASGRPVTPLYLWADTRSWRQAEELAGEMDGEAIHQRTGCLLHPSYWPAKVAWLRSLRPDLWEKRPRLLSFADLVHLRFFGSAVTGISMASGTGLLGLADCAWDTELLQRLDVRPEQLSELGVAGCGLRPEFSARWPSLRQIPWLCAAGDGALANFGSSCTDITQRALTVGTSGALRTLYAGRPERIPAGLWCYRLDRRRAVVGGSLSNGGNLFAWLIRTLAVDLGTLETQLSRMPPAASGLTFVPLLAGERSPGFASHASGSLAGLTQATTPLDIVRTGLEATAIEFGRVDKLLDDVLPGARRLVANGAGLLASPAWMQIMADAIGKPVAQSRAREASSRGAAILALEHIGELDGDSLASEVGRTYLPVTAAHQVYSAQTAKQEALYRVLVRERLLDTIDTAPAAIGGRR